MFSVDGAVAVAEDIHNQERSRPGACFSGARDPGLIPDSSYKTKKNIISKGRGGFREL